MPDLRESAEVVFITLLSMYEKHGRIQIKIKFRKAGINRIEQRADSTFKFKE